LRPIVLLDGGMGQELLRRSARRPTNLWSAQVMLDEPQIVEDVHRDYIEAGARVITLNAYSATPERLERAGMADRFEALQARAVELAASARDRSGRDVAIAGCLPPLNASYRPDLGANPRAMLATYRRIAELQAPHVDIMLCETLASVLEIGAATRAAAETGRPVWTAMTLADGERGLLRSGEPLGEGIDAAIGNGAQVLLLNCSWPETVSAALDELAAAGRPFGAYANAFTSVTALQPGGTVEGLTARTDLDPEAYCGFALSWADKGAAIVGGCCEVGPQHIARLARNLIASGYAIDKVVHA